MRRENRRHVAVESLKDVVVIAILKKGANRRSIEVTLRVAIINQKYS